jgi:MATE family multidrug resistance protein
MSSIVDDITPNDAADANDPGRGNIFTQPQQEIDRVKLGCCSGFLESLLVLAMPGEEMRRVVFTTVPLAIGAMSEAVVQLVTAVFISHYLGTEAMIAYLLVGLFVRLTSEELSGAIIDAASSFVQVALYSEQPDATLIAGQYVQHAIVLQILLGVPLLAAWAIYMENVVHWLVQSDSIAELAREYTRVIVVYFLVQSVTRTCTVVFHICGHEHFESVIDFTTLSLKLIVVASVVAQVESASLITVGYIQVLIGVAGAVAKLMFSVMRGWMKPFRKGFFGQVALFYDRQGFVQLCRAVIPLLLGTFLEYSEWEILTLFLHRLGSAEVAAWAILGVVWDILEALTEGIGEAAAIQVAFLLAARQPERARRLANTVMYLATVQSLIVTSLLYMLGKDLSVILTSDPTLQHFVNNSIALLGLANVTMAFSQVGWSLIGAQGRFRLATSVVFAARWLVSIPAAFLIIYVWELDIDALGGALVFGCATASCAMTYIVLRSDWERLSHIMQDMSIQKGAVPAEGDDDNDHGDPFEGEDSSSEGFGFGGADDDSQVTGVKSQASRSIRSKVKPTTNQ